MSQMLEDISDAHYVFLNDACNVTSCIPLRKGTKIYRLASMPAVHLRNSA